VLVLGAGGMLGHQLMRQLANTCSIAGTTRVFNQQLAVTGAVLFSDVDVKNIETVEKCIDRFRPDVILNAIGIIDQFQESHNVEQLIQINSLFPHQLARICNERNIRLILFSTDGVFSNTKGAPCTEQDDADARDLYGLSKYLGEVQQPGVLTIRTSIFGHELKGKYSLLEWVSSCAGTRISGYTHALFSGFTTLEISRIVSMIIDEYPDMHGTYHVSSDPISKYDLINIINKVYDLGIEISRDMEFKCDRRLDSSLFRKQTGYNPPSWHEMIKEMHADHEKSLKRGKK